jgi:hypothetical protein
MPKDAESRASYVTIGGKRYLTYPDGLAKELRRSDRTIRRMTARREGPPIISFGNTKLVDPEDLSEWLATLKKKLPIDLFVRRRGRSRRSPVTGVA